MRHAITYTQGALEVSYDGRASLAFHGRPVQTHSEDVVRRGRRWGGLHQQCLSYTIRLVTRKDTSSKDSISVPGGLVQYHLEGQQVMWWVPFTLVHSGSVCFCVGQ